jgi:hypothetical protein
MQFITFDPLMEELATYFELGLWHIADIQAFDHMLFLGALWLSIPYGNYSRAFWAVTAFTVGHSLTLALAIFNVVEVNRAWIEFLIPVTILLTLIASGFRKRVPVGWAYGLTVVFGFIHGLGFSGYLDALLGKNASIILPLLGFNLGVEAGQILILAVFALCIALMIHVFKLNKQVLRAFAGGAIFVLTVQLILETKFW